MELDLGRVVAAGQVTLHWEAAFAAEYHPSADPDYQKLLAMVTAGKSFLKEINRFDMPAIRPRIEWVREMRRYGVLPPDLDASDPLDVYAVERDYWSSLWYRAE